MIPGGQLPRELIDAPLGPARRPMGSDQIFCPDVLVTSAGPPGTTGCLSTP